MIDINVNVYKLPSNYYVYVGYPKSYYKDDNLNITNTVELWGRYPNESDPNLVNTSSIKINLANYDFSYNGNLYSISKSYDRKSGNFSFRFQDIINNLSHNEVSWFLYPTAYYTGIPMTIKVGDDVLFATSNDGKPVKLNDNEYYFSEICWYPNSFYNGNMDVIKANKYDCELYIRYANTQQYVKFESFKNPSQIKKWRFSKEKGVVGFFFIICDMQESLYQPSNYVSVITTKTKFIKENIPEFGSLYNFNYVQIFFKDKNGNLVLQNEPDLSSYSNFITKEDIAIFDM